MTGKELAEYCIEIIKQDPLPEEQLKLLDSMIDHPDFQEQLAQRAPEMMSNILQLLGIGMEVEA